MAVAVTVDIPGGNQQVYEQLTGRLFQDGKLPEGWQIHLTRHSPARSSFPPSSRPRT